MSYKKLEIWQKARVLVNETHQMTFTALPLFERYEQGAQLRRSIKSVKANIVEGYGRRMYKRDFLRFLAYASASLDESIDHLETLAETRSLTDIQQFEQLRGGMLALGKQLHAFKLAVERQHRTGA
ncbi:MAG: four helix bundle protein [Rhodothermales bacterium]